ncbi:MAG: hypothetical protein R3A48_16890 [Polyangiales bacterium]
MMLRRVAWVWVSVAFAGGACRTAVTQGTGGFDAGEVDGAARPDVPATDTPAATDVVATDAQAPVDVAVTDVVTEDAATPPMDGGAPSLAAVRAAITGANPVTLNVALSELVVTRVVAATPGADGGVSANDPAGFFVQSGMTGPAVFVAVDPASLTPAPQAGDRVSFTATQGRVAAGAKWITAVGSFMRAGSGADLGALTQNLSAAGDLVTNLEGYESELVRVDGAVSGGFASAGTGFESAQITTAGISMAVAGLRLRVPSALRMARDLRQGCTFRVTAPLWRFNAQAQVHAWEAGDLTDVNCPPVVDAGAPDAGALDAGVPDAGAPDAGPVDSGPAPGTDVPRVDAGAEPTPTELWALRLGTGTGSLSSAPTAGFIERIRISDGMNAADPIALPVAMSGSNQPITLSGSSDSEGQLTRSADRRFVLLAGYAVAPGSITTSVTATTEPRVIARVSANGTVDTSTTLGAAFSGTAVRGAASADGQTLWAFGQSTGAGGIFTAAFGASTATATITTPTNVRHVDVFDSALYGTVSVSGLYGAFRVEGTAGVLLPGFPTSSGPSRYGLLALDRDMTPGIDTIYQCDDGSVSSTGLGGVYKHTLVAGTWTSAGPYRMGLSTGCRAITGFASGADVTLLITSGGSANRIFRAVDTGGAPDATPWTEIRRAGSNTGYRGLALAPR